MSKPKIPKVRIARPDGRPIQLRYTDPETKREVRISTGTRDEDEAADQKEKLEAKLLLGPKLAGVYTPDRVGFGGFGRFWEPTGIAFEPRNIGVSRFPKIQLSP
jgi:hypothetical protein